MYIFYRFIDDWILSKNVQLKKTSLRKLKTLWEIMESAKSSAWHTCMLVCFACLRACVLTCLACLHAGMLGMFACLHASMFGMFACLACLHTYMLAYLCACVLGILLCLYVCALLTCFLWCVLDMLTIDALTFLSNYLFCLHKSRLCN